MIERVVEAIAGYWVANGFDPSEPDDVLARHILEMMREPTAVMVKAGWNAPKTPYDIWRAMIDEALKC